MKNFIFLLGAMLIFSISSAQTQRTATDDSKSVRKSTTVTAADGSTLQQSTTTTTTTTDAQGNTVDRQNTSDIVTPVGAKVNATDGQTETRNAATTDPANTDAVKTTTTTTTTKTKTAPTTRP